MGRVIASLVAAALAAAAAVGLVACGSGDDANLLPGRSARQITANLDRVERMAASGDCVGARDAADQVAQQVDELGDVDRRLKEALREGAEKLGDALSECVEATPKEVETEPAPSVGGTTAEPPAEAGKGHGKPKPKPSHEATPAQPVPTPPATTPSKPPAKPPKGEGHVPPPASEGKGQGEGEAEGGEPSSGGVGPGEPPGGSR